MSDCLVLSHGDLSGERRISGNSTVIAAQWLHRLFSFSIPIWRGLLAAEPAAVLSHVNFYS
jgi:hypothetical protein